MSDSLHPRLALVALGLGGCQLVTGLGSLETDPTGSGGATSSTDVGSATSATTTGGATTTSSTGGAGGMMASTSVASSSSTGLPPDLPPCGNTTDTFVMLDSIKWAFVAASVNGSGELVLAPPDDASGATAQLKAKDLFDDCYSSVKLAAQDDNTTASIAVLDTGTPASEFDRVAYESSSGIIAVNGTATTVTAPPAYLGIALHGGFVYFFYAVSNSWTYVSKVVRPSWMGGAHDDSFQLRCDSTQGKKCTMDDFNVKPIYLSDLPP